MENIKNIEDKIDALRFNINQAKRNQVGHSTMFGETRGFYHFQ